MLCLLMKLKSGISLNISVNCKSAKMGDHILKIPRPVVLDCKCFKLTRMWNNVALNKDDIKVVALFPCLLGQPVELMHNNYNIIQTDKHLVWLNQGQGVHEVWSDIQIGLEHRDYYFLYIIIYESVEAFEGGKWIIGQSSPCII